MQRSLTKGPITSSILLFALQQMYNIADTWVVGRFLGADALADIIGIGYYLKKALKIKEKSTKTETRNLLEPLGSEQVPGFYFCTMLAHFYFATAPFLLCEKAGISLQRPERPFHD